MENRPRSLYRETEVKPYRRHAISEGTWARMRLQMLLIQRPKMGLMALEKATGLDPLEISRWMNRPIPRLEG